MAYTRFGRNGLKPPGRAEPHYHIWTFDDRRRVLMGQAPRFGTRQAAHQFFKLYREEVAGYKVMRCTGDCPWKR